MAIKSYYLASAVWCMPCKMLKERIIKQNIGNVTVVDMDEDAQFLKDHGVKSIPCLVIKDSNGAVSLVNGTEQILKVLAER